MKFSSVVERIGGDRVAAWDIHFAAQEAATRGEDVILLSVGDPDFDSPAAAIAAATSALAAGDSHYTELRGRIRLRRAIAREHDARLGVPAGTTDPETGVIVTSGAQNALFSVLMLLAETGEEVIVPEPMYLTYEATVRASGAKVVTVPLPAAGGWRLDAAAIAAAVTPATRAILFATPGNPTGVVASRAELEAVARVAIEHDLWVVADEVYADLVYEGPHVSIAALPGMAERTVTISSLSKSHAMTGWRVGWAIGPEALMAHLENLNLAMLYGLPGFVQEGAAVALEQGHAFTKAMTEVYAKRRAIALEALSNIEGIRPVPPAGGMFLMVDVSGLGMTTTDFAWGLFEATGVSVLDAGAFGPSADGHVRLSFVCDEATLADACARIGRYAHDMRTKPRQAVVG